MNQPTNANRPPAAGELVKRERAEQLTSSILEDLGVATLTFWAIGRKLHEIHDDELYLSLGFPTFAAYVDGRLGVAIRQARKLVRVVRTYVQQDAERIGFERADALIAYGERVGVDPGLLVRQNAAIGDKRVSDASVRDIQTAAQKALETKRAQQKRTPVARRLTRENKAIAAGVRDLLAQIDVRRAKLEVVGGEVVVRIPRTVLAKRFGA